jgi:type I restriction enzyme S subunit
VSALQTERPLGELCEFQRGLTYGKSDEVALSESVVLRANNIDLATNSLDLSELRYIAPSVQVPESKRVRAGALLICTASGSKSHLGKVAYVDADYCYAFGGFMGQLVPAKGVEGRYLFHALTSPRYKSFIDELSDGLNINNLKFDDLRRFQIPVPGVEEQRRIVAILDEAFEGIATAKAHAERSLRNAREMFTAHLQAVFAQRDPGWVTKTVQQWVDAGVLAKPQDGNHGEIHPTKADYVDFGVPFIMAADMIEGGVDTEGCRFISRAQASSLRIGFAKSGDVLLSHKGTIGRVAILVTSDDYVILTPQVTYYRSLDGNRLFNGFLYYCLLSPEFQAAMNHIAGAGSTRAYIGITRQLDLQLTLPPIDVQRETAVWLRRIDEASRRLAGIYEEKLKTLDELKQSLLYQAFSGQL